MSIGAHTRLMNYVIGLCNRTKNWPCTLAEHGYKVQLIEKSIRTSTAEIVVPDIIAVSNKTRHSLLFDCKTGSTIKVDQVMRYKSLKNENFSHWLDIYDRERMLFDVCFVDFDANHASIKKNADNFPILSFSTRNITRENSFKVDQLNAAFKNPISMEGSSPPLSYYPFSDSDDYCEIIPHILRGLVSLVLEKGTKYQDFLSQDLFNNDEILQRIHKMWPALSEDHRNNLRKKIKEIVGLLKDKYKDTFAKQLEEISTRRGQHIHGTLSSFAKTCEQIIADCEEQKEKSQKLISEFSSS